MLSVDGMSEQIYIYVSLSLNYSIFLSVPHLHFQIIIIIEMFTVRAKITGTTRVILSGATQCQKKFVFTDTSNPLIDTPN